MKAAKSKIPGLTDDERTHWAVRITPNIMPRSVAQDDLWKAVREWVYTGECTPYDNASHTCELCDQGGLKYHFAIRNKQTGFVLNIGSDCIRRFSIEGMEQATKDSRRLAREAGRRREQAKLAVYRAEQDVKLAAIESRRDAEASLIVEAFRRDPGADFRRFARSGWLTVNQILRVLSVVRHHEIDDVRWRMPAVRLSASWERRQLDSLTRQQLALVRRFLPDSVVRSLVHIHEIVDERDSLRVHGQEDQKLSLLVIGESSGYGLATSVAALERSYRLAAAGEHNVVRVDTIEPDGALSAIMITGTALRLTYGIWKTRESD